MRNAPEDRRADSDLDDQWMHVMTTGDAPLSIRVVADIKSILHDNNSDQNYVVCIVPGVTKENGNLGIGSYPYGFVEKNFNIDFTFLAHV